jgi:hypothetical protein
VEQGLHDRHTGHSGPRPDHEPPTPPLPTPQTRPPHKFQQSTAPAAGIQPSPELHPCTPRPDLVAGRFNPEVFTASLKQVGERGRVWGEAPSSIHPIIRNLLKLWETETGDPKLAKRTKALLFGPKE